MAEKESLAIAYALARRAGNKSLGVRETDDEPMPVDDFMNLKDDLEDTLAKDEHIPAEEEKEDGSIDDDKRHLQFLRSYIMKKRTER